MILRCLTFNIWKNEGDYPRRMAAIRELLRRHRPDVVALQECFVAPALGLDSATFVADGAYRVTRHPARAKLRRHGGALVESRSDMALLTRALPLATGYHALPEDPRDGERGLLWVDLPVAGGLRLGCTHLTHLHDEAGRAIRAAQAGEAVGTLLTGRSRALLLGDLNAPAEAGELAALFRHPWLRPTTVTAQAIDHILLFSEAGDASLSGPSPITSPDGDNHPSDHPALLAEVVLP